MGQKVSLFIVAIFLSTANQLSYFIDTYTLYEICNTASFQANVVTQARSCGLTTYPPVANFL